MTKKVLLKVIVLGDSGVGKTALMTQFVVKKFSYTYKTTIGADFMAKELNVDDRLAVLQIWDTAGQDRFRSLGTSFYRGADACILVYDVNIAKSWEHVENWRNEFIMEVGIPDPHNFPFVVVGNKMDLRTEMVVSDAEVQQWCEAHGNIPLYLTSAKDGTNVDQVFKTVVDLSLKNYITASEGPNQGLPLTPHEETSSSTCC